MKNSIKSDSITLAHILTPDRVVFIEERTKEAALIRMVDVLSSAKEVTDRDDLLTHIFYREELMSTGIGMGIAIPHTRIKSVDDLVVAFGICRTPLTDYQSLDEAPVKLIIMIAAESQQHAQHIKTLSMVTRILKDKQRYQGIISATNEDDVYKILTGAL